MLPSIGGLDEQAGEDPAPEEDEGGDQDRGDEAFRHHGRTRCPPPRPGRKRVTPQGEP
ncbi:hypothetical protein GCM10017786_52900 [Amycolatopsis deserti]|uniref:Uncharacterized protein n=1 Tax=Amycolatopsis deserti TaxID=185696 RepID=A0ABQ3JBC0_9PSEU|nr:hypothetical protein GCM10017786_52900 [Amycolatopsis deserti]